MNMEACKSPPGFGVRLSFLALFFSGPPEHHIARGMAVLPVLLTSFCNSINALGLEYFWSNLLEFSRISSETRSGVEGGNSGDDGRRMWQKYSTADDFQIFGRI